MARPGGILDGIMKLRPAADGRREEIPPVVQPEQGQVGLQSGTHRPPNTLEAGAGAITMARVCQATNADITK
jgi:hypothetical protein